MQDYGKRAPKGPTQKLADGGTVGLWERLKAGNIDKEGSEANKRWGSGSKAASTPAPAPAPEPAPAPAPAAAADNGSYADDDTPDYGNEGRRMKTASPEPAPKRRTASAPAKSRTAAGDASPSAAPSAPDYGNESRRSATPGAARSKGFYANASDNAPDMDPYNYIGRAKSAFDLSRYKVAPQVANYVDGGLVGKGTQTAASVPAEPFHAWSENALGGGRKSYGKK